MAVALLVEESLGAGAVSDAIAGGVGQVGVDLLSCVNAQYAPIISKAANTGRQDLYISHDGTNEITDVGFFISSLDATGYTYGGAAVNAAADLATLITLGSNTDKTVGSQNNGNGTSGGFWIDMSAIQASPGSTQFILTNNTTFIFGDSGGVDGVDLASAFPLITAANIYDAPGETAATAPVAGEIGRSLVTPDTAKGSHIHVRTRLYLPENHADGGLFQWALTVKYSFTS